MRIEDDLKVMAEVSQKCLITSKYPLQAIMLITLYYEKVHLT